MKTIGRMGSLRRHRSCFLISWTTLVLACSIYIDQVVGLPPEVSANSWPTFPRRNVAALARDGYLRSAASGYKRSISTLAKNGQLPTFKSPYDETDKQEHEDEDDESHEKRNLASIARMRSYSAIKRNIQSLARDGYRFGRGQYSQQNDKRNIAALARNGLIHKKDEMTGDEYYFPFYQNPVPPLSEIDGPLDINEIYDLQQSVNPDMLTPLSQVFKRSDASISPDFMQSRMGYDGNWYLKRGAFGMPAHGLYRPTYIETSGNVRNRRSVFQLPDVIDRNDIPNPEDYDNDNEDKRSVDEDDEVTRENFEKRHIGSLARLGLLPSFRFTGGRYSRSGRARLLLPSQELYRKHSPDENFGIRQYFTDTEVDTSGNSNDADIPPPPVPAHSHPTGRYLHRPLNNDVPNTPLPKSPLSLNNPDNFGKNRWQSNSNPRFYYFRSLKVPYHTSGKRYLLLPAVDNILLRKSYRNGSLPSRRKNQ